MAREATARQFDVDEDSGRASGREEQAEWRDRLMSLGISVTPVMDRTYFESIYFHAPDGLLVEIATDGPGFTVDESLDSLGEALKLPDRLEPRRQEIERSLTALGDSPPRSEAS